jgi:hypothetical protein
VFKISTIVLFIFTIILGSNQSFADVSVGKNKIINGQIFKLQKKSLWENSFEIQKIGEVKSDNLDNGYFKNNFIFNDVSNTIVKQNLNKNIINNKHDLNVYYVDEDITEELSVSISRIDI